MAKVTEQDVVNFLKEKVAQITKELESAQSALNALQGTGTAQTPSAKGRKPTAETPAIAKRKSKAKTGSVKRGRKPGPKKFPTERVLPADQLG